MIVIIIYFFQWEICGGAERAAQIPLVRLFFLDAADVTVEFFVGEFLDHVAALVERGLAFGPAAVDYGIVQSCYTVETDRTVRFDPCGIVLLVRI